MAMSIATEKRELCKFFREKCQELTGPKPYSSRSINKGKTYRVSIPFGAARYCRLVDVRDMNGHVKRADEILNHLEAFMQTMPGSCYVTYQFHVGACLYISFRLDVRS
jgi:hypothetical protein